MSLRPTQFKNFSWGGQSSRKSSAFDRCRDARSRENSPFGRRDLRDDVPGDFQFDTDPREIVAQVRRRGVLAIED